MTFKRENRYLVLRWDDINKYLLPTQLEDLDEIIDTIVTGRFKENKDPHPNFVCIKDTYPEYEYCWKKIEERMNAG